MKAMVLEQIGQPVQSRTLPLPQVKPGKLLIKVSACGICRTDLHVVDGDLPQPRLPIVPGHQIVGYIAELGPDIEGFSVGQRVGVPWLGGSCGCCPFCCREQENLCDQAVYTGYQLDGGFAEYTLADARYCFALPEAYSDLDVAPLLCAGLIGYRAYRLAAEGQHIGIYGFGAAAHILTQVACYQGKQVYAFTRSNDKSAQQFALGLGAVWAGDSMTAPPRLLDAAIIFASVGELVPAALAALRKGGKVICAGIHMSDIPAFPYHLLWGERSIHSIANLTRKDAEEFLPLAGSVPVKTEVHRYSLDQANQALDDLRYGRFNGAAVIEFS